MSSKDEQGRDMHGDLRIGEVHLVQLTQMD